MTSLLLALCVSLSAQAYAGSLDDSMATLKANITKLGEPKLEGTAKAGDQEVPVLYFGKKKINGNYDAVDNVKKKHGGTATVFVASGDEFICVTTNVLKGDGTRGVGIALPHGKAYAAIKKGEGFCGEVEILKSMYDTCYEPIKDAAGKTLGIFYVGIKK